MKIYKTTLLNGKETTYTFPFEGQRYIYKQRKLPLGKWIEKMAGLMLKANYDEYDIEMSILFFVKIKGYWQHENYYIKPDYLVQNLNDLGGIKNIDFV